MISIIHLVGSSYQEIGTSLHRPGGFFNAQPLSVASSPTRSDPTVETRTIQTQKFRTCPFPTHLRLSQGVGPQSHLIRHGLRQPSHRVDSVRHANWSLI